jgi:hypothetical protein
VSTFGSPDVAGLNKTSSSSVMAWVAEPASSRIQLPTQKSGNRASPILTNEPSVGSRGCTEGRAAATPSRPRPVAGGSLELRGEGGGVVGGGRRLGGRRASSAPYGTRSLMGHATGCEPPCLLG